MGKSKEYFVEIAILQQRLFLYLSENKTKFKCYH